VMKERSRIAREIHDSLAQGLAAIGLHVSAIQSEPSAAGRERHVQKARQLVETNLAEARRSVWDLHPQYLDRQDLVSALGRIAADLGEHAKVRIAIRSTGSPFPLPADVEKNIFRIAQEALANAVRHASARQIEIEMVFERHQVRITIADDGRGFDPGAVSDGFGLTSMRERAAHVGAAFELQSRPTGGTRVMVDVPATSDQPPVVAHAHALVRAIRRRAANLSRSSARARTKGHWSS